MVESIATMSVDHQIHHILPDCHLLSRTGPGALSIAWVYSDCTRSKRRCFTSVLSCISSSASTSALLGRIFGFSWSLRAIKKRWSPVSPFSFECIYRTVGLANSCCDGFSFTFHAERWFKWWKMDFKLKEIALTEHFHGFLLREVSSWCSCRDIELCARETKADVGRGAFTTRKRRQRRCRLRHPRTIGSLYLEMEDEPRTLSNCFRLDMSLIWIQNRI